jgi:putative ABC transport system permease protein
MLLVSLRDLQWRRRRFLIAVGAAALVFAMTLLLSGLSSVIDNEPSRIVKALGADAFVVPSGSSGPFTSTNVVLTDRAQEIESDGVHAVPFAYFHATVKDKDVNVVAAGDDASAHLKMKSGRRIEGPGEAVADQFSGLDAGDTTDVAGVPMEIVGISKGTTFNFGAPTVFVPIGDAQKMLFAGQPVATAFMIEGDATTAPEGMRLMNLSEVVTDMKRPIKQGADSILFINILLWIVAAGIIGSIVYLSSLERASDFAVLKATGTSTSSLVVGLALQAIILCAASAIVASLLAQLLKAGFPFEVETTTGSYVTLVVVAVGVGLLASLAGLRRTVAVDPALAFG